MYVRFACRGLWNELVAAVHSSPQHASGYKRLIYRTQQCKRAMHCITAPWGGGQHGVRREEAVAGALVGVARGVIGAEAACGKQESGYGVVGVATSALRCYGC